jgi:hypothetical protein
VLWWRREKKEISEFLYALLVGDAPRGYAKEVAARMNVPYPTLSKYWQGKRRFPASLVKPLFLATDQDARVAEFFLLDGSRYRLHQIDDPPAAIDLSRGVMLLSSLDARVTELFLAATAPEGEQGEQISPAEATALESAVARLIEHAETLRAALRRRG